jgi:hypothetical protein
MMISDKYKYYLEEFGGLVKEYALGVKENLLVVESEEKVFTQGELYACYRLITMMQQQAIAFDIDLKEINLSDINPDKNLT